MISEDSSKNPNSRLRLGKGELWALAGAVFYALNNVLTGLAVQGNQLDYWLGVSLRALPLLPLALAFGWNAAKRDPKVVSPLANRKIVAALVASGLLNFVVGGPPFLAALHEGGVLIATPVANTQVLWAAILASLFLHERFTRRMALGMVVCIAGIFVLALGRSGGITASARWWLAIPYATVAAAAWALSGVLIAYAMRRGVDRFQALAVSALTGIVVINLTMLLRGTIAAYVTTLPALTLSVLAAGLMGVFALICLVSAFALTTVASANTINALQVAIAPLLAWAFLGERLNVVVGLGLLVILVGVIIVQQARATLRRSG